jgi:Ca-activated chloride channel family protein
MINRVIRPRIDRALRQALAPDDRARIGTWRRGRNQPGPDGQRGAHPRASRGVVARRIHSALACGYRGDDVARGRAGRRVILVLTDGGDTDYLPGRPSPGDVKQTAIRGSFMIYAIGMEREADGPTIRVNNNVMSLSPGGLSTEMIEVAEETGGGHFKLETASDLDATFARVAEELRHQYLLGFAPATLDARSHKIEVRVTEPGCSVRARRSYIAQ